MEPYESVAFPKDYERYCRDKLDRVMKFLNKRDRILDAGCGGEMHPYCFLKLKETYPNLVGVDLDNKWNPRILRQDLLDLKFRDGDFDVGICMDVLEHIEDWERALNNLIRVSSRRIVIIVPTTENRFFSFFTKMIRRFIGVENRIMAGHHREFFPGQITGFRNPKIERVRFYKIGFPVSFLSKFMKKFNFLYAGIYVIDLKD